MSRLRTALGLLAVLSAPFASAQTKAAPQLLPYTITAVAGGGPTTVVQTATASTYTPVLFTVGQTCATGSTLTAADIYGDGCLATQVALVLPRAVVADTQGNLFLVDGYNELIRRVDARTGIITAYAGGGTAVTCNTSTYGDGCAATAVKLTAPEGLGIDPANNVWYSDYTLGSVRRIDHATGILTTIVNTAGTPGYRAGNVANAGTVVLAAAGQLVHPYGVSFDRAGNLYIADNYNSTVEVVNLQSTATTIAAVSIPAGAIYTIAGTGCAYGNSTTGCTTYGKTGAGGASTASTLDSPYQVAVDNANNIYIADEYPYDVRVINGSTGIITTFANGAFTKSATEVRGAAATTSLASTQGVATDANGNVYITVYDTTTTSSYLHRVDAATGILYPLAGQVVTAAPTQGAANLANTAATYCAAKTDNVGDGCPGTQATLYSPFQPFVDAAGNVYFADQKNLLIRKLSVGTQFPAAVTGKSVTQSVVVHYGAADTQGTYTLPTVGSGFGAVDFTLGTAACTVNSDTTQDCVLPVTFTPTAAGLRSASLVVKSTSGLISSFALTGTGNAALLLTDSTSNTGSAGTLGSGPFPAVAALAGDSAGNLYAAVPTAAGIRKISGTAATTLGTVANAVAVTTDPSGNLYAAVSGGGYIVEIPASGATQFPFGSGTGFTSVSGLAADAFGNLYVSDSSANTVTRIAAGTLNQVVVATGLNGPTGLAVDAAGNIFVANTVGNNVIEIPVSGAANITLGTGLSSPRAVATDASGSLYVADTRNARVVFIPNESGTLTSGDQLTVATLGLTTPTGLVLSASGVLYVADSTANAIYIYNRTAATQAFGNDPLGTQLTAAADLISAGNLPVILSTPYYTVTGNTADFSLSPSTTSASATPVLPSGYGFPLVAGFNPTATGTRTATYSFTGGVTLTLTGTGIIPVNATTTTIAANPTTGTYGTTVAVTFTVAVPTGKAAATGTVTVKVDTTTYTPTLNASGVATLSLTGLSAATHTITANYPGDTSSSPSTATPVTVTLAPAPLTITPASVSKAYYAAVPTLTGTLTGVVNGDTIGVTYSTTATQTSALGTYPISASVTGTAAANYTVTVTPGVLTIVKAGTTTLLTTSATAVASTTSVTLTATVTPVSGGVPTGTVTFYNGTAVIATVTLTNGTASTATTFAVVGQSSTNVITAVYSGDTNYTTSTSSLVTVVSSTPGFAVTGAPTAASVIQGQSALLSFTVTPTFGYTGTIVPSCANLPATINCVFSPTSVTATGANTANLIAMSITTVQPGSLVQNAAPTLTPRSTISFALLPGFALLLGLATRRRKFRGLLVVAVSAVLAIGISGCGTGHFSTPTPVGGPYNITVNLTGTPNATVPTANLTSSFTVALTVTSK